MNYGRRTSCVVCGAALPSHAFPVKDMMFGTGKEYNYKICDSCGALVLGDVATVEESYPTAYYSHKPLQEKHAILQTLDYLSVSLALKGETYIAPILSRLNSTEAVRALAPFRKEKGLRVLDVGCGSGALIKLLLPHVDWTFLGVDPYVPGDTEISARAHVKKLGVGSCQGQWDLILANHCLEHVEEPEHFMRELKRLLAPAGTLVLRVPIFRKYAWRRYGTHWFQIDAPRHIFIPSLQTIEMLAQKCDLSINVAKFDSSETQFWGSSRYEHGMSLVQSDMNWRAAILKIARIPYWYPFYCAAQTLNWKRDGDQAAFYLKHA